MAEGRPNLQEERKGPSNEAGQAASGRGLRAEGAVRPAFPVDSTRTKGAKGGRQRKERGNGKDLDPRLLKGRIQSLSHCVFRRIIALIWGAKEYNRAPPQVRGSRSCINGLTVLPPSSSSPENVILRQSHCHSPGMSSYQHSFCSPAWHPTFEHIRCCRAGSALPWGRKKLRVSRRSNRCLKGPAGGDEMLFQPRQFAALYHLGSR